MTALTLWFARLTASHQDGSPRSLWRQTLCLGALFGLLSLTGCEPPEGRLIAEHEKQEEERVGTLTNTMSQSSPHVKTESGDPMPLEIPNAAPSLNPADVTGADHTVAGALEGNQTQERARQGEDYRQKADTYWKLNWIRKQILLGELPANLDDILTVVRREAVKSSPDANQRLALDALDYLERGWVHLQASRTLENALVASSAVPWQSSADGLRQFIASNALGFGGKSASISLRHESDDEDSHDRQTLNNQRTITPEQEKALRTITTYAARYSASPATKMQEEWREAIHKINRLRNELGLQDRKENSDGDSAFVGTVIRLSAPANVEKTLAPLTRIASGVEPPSTRQ